MLEENKALRMRLHSLTIFRGLLEDPVVSRLAALLHAQPSDAEACADAYCAFAAALYERGGDLSTYLLKAVLEDENLYVRRAASGASIPAELAECLQHELCFLQELSKFDGAALRGARRALRARLLLRRLLRRGLRRLLPLLRLFFLLCGLRLFRSLPARALRGLLNRVGDLSDECRVACRRAERLVLLLLGRIAERCGLNQSVHFLV